MYYSELYSIILPKYRYRTVQTNIVIVHSRQKTFVVKVSSSFVKASILARMASRHNCHSDQTFWICDACPCREPITVGRPVTHYNSTIILKILRYKVYEIKISNPWRSRDLHGYCEQNWQTFQTPALQVHGHVFETRLAQFYCFVSTFVKQFFYKGLQHAQWRRRYLDNTVGDKRVNFSFWRIRAAQNVIGASITLFHLWTTCINNCFFWSEWMNSFTSPLYVEFPSKAEFIWKCYMRWWRILFKLSR